MTLATVTLQMWRRGSAQDVTVHATWIACHADGRLAGISLIGPNQAVLGVVAAIIQYQPLTYRLPAADGEEPPRLSSSNGLWSPQPSHWRQFRQRVRLQGAQALHVVMIPEDAFGEPDASTATVIGWSEADRTQAEWDVLTRTTVPLDPSWRTPLLALCAQGGHRLGLYRVPSWAAPGTAHPQISVFAGLDQLGTVVSAAVQRGLLTVPEGPGPNPASPVPHTASVDDYLTAWAPALGSQMQTVVQPRAQAGTDAPAAWATLPRPPFPAQRDVIQALATTLDTESWALIIGEQGVGKTLQMALTPWELFRRRDRAGFRVLVLAPDHLLPKWRREIVAAVPGAEVRTLGSWRDTLALAAEPRRRPDHPVYVLLGRDRAKLSYRTAFAGRWSDRRGGWICPDCGQVLINPDGTPWSEHITKRVRTRHCPHCQTALWSADGSLRRLAPAEILRRRTRGLWDAAIIDEVHELKGATEQGQVLAWIRGLVPRLLVGTGTLSSGYADDLHYLQWRLNPQAMAADRLPHDAPDMTLHRYGRIERIERSSRDGSDGVLGKKATASVRTKRLPGISPLWYATKLVDHAAVLTLADIGAEALPSYSEEVAWIAMTEDQAAWHQAIMSRVRSLAQAALAMGSTKLLGRLLATGLTLPDEPWATQTVSDPTTGDLLLRKEAPVSLTPDTLYPKEQRLLEEIRAADGGVWIYASFTNTHDQLARLSHVFTQAGIAHRVLRPDVKRADREAWIQQAAADGVRVILSHPQLVETGLDLLAWPTLVWYSTGYNLFRLRQASRRAWRIGQTAPCRVVFLAYADTLQADALRLMGAKLATAMGLEGQLSLTGLQALAQDNDVSNGLARALAYGLAEQPDISTVWQTAAAVVPASPDSAAAAPPAPLETARLVSLPSPQPPTPPASVRVPPRLVVVRPTRRITAPQLAWAFDDDEQRAAGDV